MRSLILRTVIFCIFIAITISGSYSQDIIERKIYNTKFAEKPPLIDGFMNDDCWDIVEWAAM